MADFNAAAKREMENVKASELEVSSGPIPSTETLAQYDKVYPGLAQKIIQAFEAEYLERHRIETMAMEGDILAMRLDHGNVKRGQWLGFLICMTGLISGSILVYLGHDVAGAALGGVSLASVVAAYFKGSIKSNNSAGPEK